MRWRLRLKQNAGVKRLVKKKTAFTVNDPQRRVTRSS
jgi:hypothetical protein